MSDERDESTMPETPEAKRLSVPSFDLPDNPSRDDLVKAMANAIIEIADNLRYLRRDAEQREDLEKRVRRLEDKVFP